jgi:hypothetical protein
LVLGSWFLVFKFQISNFKFQLGLTSGLSVAELHSPDAMIAAVTDIQPVIR